MAAISHIQVRCNVNGQYGVSGRNVIYTRTYKNGTSDRAERVWLVYGEAPEFRPDIPCNSSKVEAPRKDWIPILTTYITNWEKAVGNKIFDNINTSGALVKVTPIKTLATIEKERLDARLQQMEKQLAAQNAANAKLQAQLKESAKNEALILQLLKPHAKK